MATPVKQKEKEILCGNLPTKLQVKNAVFKKMKIRNPFSFKNSSGWKDDATIKEKAFWIGVFVLIGAVLGYLTT